MIRAAVPDHGSIALQDLPEPTAGPGQVLLRVHAAGMNRADLLHVKGTYRQRAFTGPGPDVAGMECAGEVVAVGEGVDPGLLGTRAMAMTGGAYAESVLVDARLLLPVPDSLDWAEAAALPMALLTETEALVALGGVRAGERVLIIGGTSGVALVGLQVARALDPGILVTTSRRAEGDDLLRALGADRVLHDPDELTGLDGDGFDVVVDHVGGPWLTAALTRLRIGARVISVGRLGGRRIDLDLTALAGRRARLVGTTWKTQSLEQIAASVDAVRREVLPFVAAAAVRPVIAARVGLADITRGYERLADEREPGKVVVLVRHD